MPSISSWNHNWYILLIAYLRGLSIFLMIQIWWHHQVLKCFALKLLR
jgi:hypothetical protein